MTETRRTIEPNDSDDLRDRALLHATGGLAGDERAAFESLLADPRSGASEALREARVLAAALGASVDPVPPPPGAKERLLERARAETGSPVAQDASAGGAIRQTWKRWIETSASDDVGPGLTVVRKEEAGWENVGVPGISVRRLAVDGATGRVTMLVRMAAGTSYPTHRHGGREECYVLEGDLHVGDGLRMTAGDFQRAESGSVHPVQSTRGGCLLLIHSSQDDEILPA